MITKEEFRQSAERIIVHMQATVYDLASYYMSNRQITKEQLAKELGISLSKMKKILNMDYDFKFGELIRILKHFSK